MSRRSSYGRVALAASEADRAEDEESSENLMASGGLVSPEEKNTQRNSFFGSTNNIAVAPSSSSSATTSSTPSLSHPNSASKSKKSSVSAPVPVGPTTSNSVLDFFSGASTTTVSTASSSLSSTVSSSSSSSSSSAQSGCTFSTSDNDLQLIASLITSHPDFPKPGVVFRDIFPIFRDPRATEALMDRLYLHLYSTYFIPGQPNHLDAIAGLETRGFLFGVPLAMRLGIAFVPIRKAGKLPPPTVSTRYGKEYGGDEVELSKNSLKAGSRVVVLDDLLATGGTLVAAMELIGQANCVVPECCVVIELKALRGRERIEKDGKNKVWSLIQYD